MNLWLFLILISIFSSSPILFIIALLFLTGDLAKKSKEGNGIRFKGRKMKRSNTSNNSNTIPTYSNDQLKKVYDALNEYFTSHERYTLTSQLNLRANGHIDSLDDIDVYFDNTRLSNLIEFAKNYHVKEYTKIMDSLITFANGKSNVIDVEATVVDDKQVAKSQVKLSKSESWAKKMDDLNNDIPDYAISLKLDKTSSLLRQIGTLQAKGEESSLSSLEKMYNYYLPMLEDILNNFIQLQNQVNHSEHDKTQQKVEEIIESINDSLQTIINDMNDEDFINLNADLNTLQTLLKNDGLVIDDQLNIAKTKASKVASKQIELQLPQDSAHQEKVNEEINLKINDQINELSESIASQKNKG